MTRLMKFLILFSISAFFVSCNNFDLIGGDKKPPRNHEGDKDENPGRKANLDFEPIENIKDFDLNEIVGDLDETKKNCAKYDSGVPSISILPIFEPVKNCIAKIVDRQVGPICEYERSLDEYEERVCKNEKDRDDRSTCLDDVDEAREQLEEAKDEIAEFLYIMADDAEDLIEDSDSDDDSLEKIGGMLIGYESKSFVRFLEVKANKVCGYRFSFDKLKY